MRDIVLYLSVPDEAAPALIEYLERIVDGGEGFDNWVRIPDSYVTAFEEQP
jgi:hypothetical protein